MPVYEYECSNCSHQFELKQKFSDSPEATCPSCRSNAKRIFSPVPIIFKGSGFYVTDSRGEKKRKSDDRGDGDKPADTESKKESSTEGKKETAS